MSIHAFLAQTAIDSYLPAPQLLVPIAVGIGAGLGLVALIHFFNRHRQVATVGDLSPDVTDEVTDETTGPMNEHRPVSDPFISGSKSELRSAFRRTGNPIPVHVIDQDKQTAPMNGYVVNRSVGGLGLQLDCPIDVQTVLSVRPANAPHIAPWVEVVVKNCRKGPRGYDIGCQFVKVPPWPVLMMFG
jgi:hypothetical protein